MQVIYIYIYGTVTVVIYCFQGLQEVTTNFYQNQQSIHPYVSRPLNRSQTRWTSYCLSMLMASPRALQWLAPRVKWWMRNVGLAGTTLGKRVVVVRCRSSAKQVLVASYPGSIFAIKNGGKFQIYPQTTNICHQKGRSTRVPPYSGGGHWHTQCRAQQQHFASGWDDVDRVGWFVTAVKNQRGSNAFFVFLFVWQLYDYTLET